MSDDLVQQLADAMRADVNDGHWTGWEQTARAVLVSGLVVPAYLIERASPYSPRPEAFILNEHVYRLQNELDALRALTQQKED